MPTTRFFLPRLGSFMALLLMLPTALSAADDWHNFTDKKGRALVARVVKVNLFSVILELKDSRRQVRVDFDTLTDADVAYCKATEKSPEPATETPAGTTEVVKSRLYPRTAADISAAILEIQSRPKPPKISEENHKATIELNIYRYLCGVPSEVTANEEFCLSAKDAAETCEKLDKLSHELGHSTNKCNLTTDGDVIKSVTDYIEDSGDNNREVRGHREWCLNAPMKNVGFGSGTSKYAAMWCMDSAGKGIRGTWSYPGKGLFPVKYMHGNAWSLYGAGKPESLSKLKVEVFRLAKRPDKPLPIHGEIEGTVVAVNHVSLGMNGINFEPAEPAQVGIYWVRATGGGISEGYLVELF